MTRTNSDELRALADRLKKLEDAGVDDFCRRASRELAARLLALVIPRTPVGKKPEPAVDLVTVKGESSMVPVMTRNGERLFRKRMRTYSFLDAAAARKQEYWLGYEGGTLRRGWTAATEEEARSGSGQPGADEIAEYAEQMTVQRSGDRYIVRVINPVKYASYVEFGHRQTLGRFVPAIGKTLKEGWVRGQYCLTLSEQDLMSIAPAMLERRLDEFLREAMNDDRH